MKRKSIQPEPIWDPKCSNVQLQLAFATYIHNKTGIVDNMYAESIMAFQGITSQY